MACVQNDQVDDLNKHANECLPKAYHVGTTPALELPPMVVGELHLLESLFDLINHDQV